MSDARVEKQAKTITNLQDILEKRSERIGSGKSYTKSQSQKSKKAGTANTNQSQTQMSNFDEPNQTVESFNSEAVRKEMKGLTLEE